MTVANVDAELAKVLAVATSGALTSDECRALLEQVSDRFRRLVALRDGWKAIAVELLTVAFGSEPGGEQEIPPLEVIDLRATSSLHSKSIAALEQFWADLTRKHGEKRQARDAAIFLRGAAPGLRQGDVVSVDPSGRVITLDRPTDLMPGARFIVVGTAQ